MKYFCTECSYAFDGDLWDTEEWIKPWDTLDKCPVCEEYDCFQWIDEEVNYIDDDNNLEALEIDHFPEIEISHWKLKVIVGNEIHPMWIEHRIASVWLYDEYGDLIQTNYLELDLEAVTEFEFDDLDEFEIRVKCSTHWVWWKKFKN